MMKPGTLIMVVRSGDERVPVGATGVVMPVEPYASVIEKGYIVVDLARTKSRHKSGYWRCKRSQVIVISDGDVVDVLVKELVNV